MLYEHDREKSESDKFIADSSSDYISLNEFTARSDVPEDDLLTQETERLSSIIIDIEETDDPMASFSGTSPGNKKSLSGMLKALIALCGAGAVATFIYNLFNRHPQRMDFLSTLNPADRRQASDLIEVITQFSTMNSSPEPRRMTTKESLLHLLIRASTTEYPQNLNVTEQPTSVQPANSSLPYAKSTPVIPTQLTPHGREENFKFLNQEVLNQEFFNQEFLEEDQPVTRSKRKHSPDNNISIGSRQSGDATENAAITGHELSSEETAKLNTFSQYFSSLKLNKNYDENVVLLNDFLNAAKASDDEAVKAGNVPDNTNGFESRSYIIINGVKWFARGSGEVERKATIYAGWEYIDIERKSSSDNVWRVAPTSRNNVFGRLQWIDGKNMHRYPYNVLRFLISNVDDKIRELVNNEDTDYLPQLKLRYHLLTALYYKNQDSPQLAIYIQKERLKIKKRLENSTADEVNDEDELLDFIWPDSSAEDAFADDEDILSQIILTGDTFTRREEFINKIKDDNKYLEKRLKRIIAERRHLDRWLKSVKGYFVKNGKYWDLRKRTETLVAYWSSIKGGVPYRVRNVYTKKIYAKDKAIREIKKAIVFNNKIIRDDAGKKDADKKISADIFDIKHIEERLNADGLTQATINKLLNELSATGEVLSEDPQRDNMLPDRINLSKHYLHFRQRLNNIHADVIDSVSQYGLDKLPQAKNNYQDIINAKITALRIYYKKIGMAIARDDNVKLLKEYNSIVASDGIVANEIEYLNMLVLWCMSQSQAEVYDADPLSVLSLYNKMQRKYSHELYAFDSVRPANYIPQEDMRGSFEFENRSDYTKQYNDYIYNGSSRYDAENLTPAVLLSMQLSPEELINPPEFSAVYKPVYMKADPDNQAPPLTLHIPGYIVFTVLSSGDYIFTDTMDGEIRHTRISVAEQKILGAVDKPRNLDNVIVDKYFMSKGIKLDFFTDLELKENFPVTSTRDTVSHILKFFIDDKMNSRKLSDEVISPLTSLAYFIVPFYREIYFSQTDPYHQLDIESIVMDAIVVITGLIGMGVGLYKVAGKTASKIMQSIAKHSAAGLSRRNLLKAVIAEVPEIGAAAAAQTGKVIATELIDILDPLPTRLVLNFISKGFRARFGAGVKSTLNAGNKEGYKLPRQWGSHNVDLAHIQPENGIYRVPLAGSSQSAQEYMHYIKQGDSVFNVRFDVDNNTWRVVNPLDTGRFSYALPVRLNKQGEWVVHSDVGLKGGGIKERNVGKTFFYDESPKKLFHRTIVEAATKWPPVEIEQKIHMIWIGTKNLSEKNIALSIDTAVKNPGYSTTVIYDSAIPGYESAKSFMEEKFSNSNVRLVDIRQKDYFNNVVKEPAFKYYTQAIEEKKYAQASDLLRLFVLKYEGGIYKDIDDIQLKGFGKLAFPKGIGVMREYAPEAGKSMAFPNTPVAASKGNAVIDKTLDLAVKNYERGEQNVLKLAGPDVFTEALHKEIPGLNPKVLNQQIEQFEQAKRYALKLPPERPKNVWDEKLTIEEKEKINRPYNAIRGLAGYVDNGADHSWAAQYRRRR